MMVPMDLWNEAQEAIESLVGEDDATPQPAAKPIDKSMLKRLVTQVFGEEFQIVRQAKPAQAEPSEERFFLDHGTWHDRLTGQHMYSQTEMDDAVRDARRLLAEEQETTRQLVRALREATEPPMFMGEPVTTPKGAQAEPVARDEPTDADWADFGAWAERDKGARDMLEKLIDVWDDGQLPYEHRCYVDGAWAELIAETRSLLAASPTQPRPQPLTEQDAYAQIDFRIGGVRASRKITGPQCRQARDLRQGLIIEATIAIDSALTAHGITAQEPTE
jgi:hypothetical protein